MSTDFVCHECDREFRTHRGLDWHAQRIHGTRVGSIVNLGPEWDGKRVTTTELPGRLLMVIPSTIDWEASHGTAMEHFNEEMAQMAKVFDALRPLLPSLNIDERE